MNGGTVANNEAEPGVTAVVNPAVGIETRRSFVCSSFPMEISSNLKSADRLSDEAKLR